VIFIVALAFSLPGFFGGSEKSLIIREDRSLEKGVHFENVVLIEGQLNFAGSAEHLVILGGRAILEESARVTHLYLFEGSVEQREGAEVKNLSGKGEKLLFDAWAWSRSIKERLDGFLKSVMDWEKGRLWGFLSSFLLALPIFLGVILFVLIPGLGDVSSAQLRRAPLQSLFLGLVFLLSSIPFSILLIISLVGILLLPLLAILYLLILWLGFFVFAIFLGRLILGIFKIQHRIAALFCGLFLLFLILSAPLASFWIYQIVSLMGCGAILLSLFSNRVQIYRV
jgi:hypothetical protein